MIEATIMPKVMTSRVMVAIRMAAFSGLMMDMDRLGSSCNSRERRHEDVDTKGREYGKVGADRRRQEDIGWTWRPTT